ncbi:MAG: NAD-dependent malic enzyme [Planctomycetota bacterium]|jgi:malate dehydrogenase (oxaloacetate-decarboxylating)
MKAYKERVDPHTGERYLKVKKQGLALKSDPLLNKGTCFSQEERERFGLDGLLPPAVSSWAQQQTRAYENYLRVSGDVPRYLTLSSLQDRDETLFFRLLVDHIEEMMPIVYTPTVGKACEEYSHIYRRPRGLYINLHHRGHIKRVLQNALIDDCRVMVVTDNEAILGLGDLGVGGMGIPIGKLALYTAGAGVHPAQCLPVDLDVGTNNTKLLEDSLYLGIREPRVRGEEYFSFLDEFVEAVKDVFPKALVQWEDFSNQTAFKVLNRYRDTLPSFDDDIQGTGAVIVAGLLAAVKRSGRKLEDERAVFFGAGASGGGCALALCDAIRSEGGDPTGKVLAVDSRGLIVDDRPGLAGHKAKLAVDAGLVRGWKAEDLAHLSLLDTVRNFKPTMLVGMSGQPGAFTEEIVRAMAEHCDRPIVFPCSNPTSKAEATPEHLLRWTNGGAIVATGSPFAPVAVAGKSFEIGQANNALVFPGIGLGAIAAGARTLPDSVFLAAAQALHRMSNPEEQTASLFPPLHRLREVSRSVAFEVGKDLIACGAAPKRSEDELDKRLNELTWEPEYLEYRTE